MQYNPWWNFFTLSMNLFIFFLYWYASYRHQNNNSIPRLNKQLRQIWVRCFAEHKIDPLLAIHTLRNSIMVSTVLASSTVLFVLALFGLLGHVHELSQILNNFSFADIRPPLWLQFKVLFLIVWQVIVFFCFMTSIRYYRHSGFLVSIPFAQTSYQMELLGVYMHRAADYYSIGQKLMLFSIPICSWFLGDVIFFIATLCLLGMMHVSDKLK